MDAALVHRRCSPHEHDSEFLANLERREIGEQLRQIEAPTLPTRPFNRDAGRVLISAAGSGLLLGLTLFHAARRLSRDKPRLAHQVALTG